MIGIMHPEVLSEKTKAVWDTCGFLKGFYLAGGTALALQLGHRISVDLDFFSDNPIQRTLLSEIEGIFGPVHILVKNKDELTVIADEVKITFLYYPFLLLHQTVSTGVVPLASVKDIASMKAYTLGRRQSIKDYIDLYFIFSKNLISLSDAMGEARQKYGDAFNDRLFLEQLLYSDDLEDEEINWLQEKVGKETMSDFFSVLITQAKL
ncbi:MAG TPA: hypothetical protein DCZ84_01610 [Candidatus Vogelbacteria bacterium]|nr:MAG: hypothetical protein UY68_C0005G0037 [Parcubacteria group bacterium GW2011_GWF2_52_12]KKW27598.1 MAG: hypothetical protein UY69_C0009G0009 [Parcubacteria group bacterium GW2011_GWF1_52_5]KKW33731.1 MAG: hypothetical protein UY80_C0033G0002 [Parcubacteria group bacterium GW2011_GWB1_53_43]HBB65319.1 hypothetical protein [Candidatus Vogelbacteria bacterium]HBC44093.1 hypothetical protein [Candidatus Vogelbacteria bacterium]